ncbi:pseudouridine synthase [Neptunomonas phycophila]|uniref:pseudouridine synthase n=1 Tax=Neptunomonas phycophila TaxID=1572645 RepID=UPI0015B8B5D0|nr:pseudouridine synthase [Neptunomonas phycophila]QLE98237.1 pseudouridine synthase [Neptunomonas phycophila]
MRLDKYICKSTQLSKAEAVCSIQAGRVSVNATVAIDAALQVHENNTIELDGVQLKPRAFRYLLMHKPAGLVCSNVDEAYPSLFNLLDIERVSELHIVGRLDVDTTGLVLITDDGRWSFHITQPTNACPKVYRVGLARALSAGDIDELVAQFKQGIRLQGEQRLTLPATLEVISSKDVRLTITEGRFHQVKRMFAAVGNRVASLHREQIGDVLVDVDEGQWRYLHDTEVQSFSLAQ